MTVRAATGRDARACAAIYAPYVTDTAVSFELEAPGVAEVAGRIAAAAASHAWLVLEDAGRVVGFAYGQPFRERAAYRWACETSIYLELGRRRTGGGLPGPGGEAGQDPGLTTCCFFSRMGSTEPP